MKIAVLGTGIVGRTIAAGLAQSGHDVAVGTRNVEATLARDEPDAMGNLPYSQWRESHAGIGLTTFAEAASGSEIVVNATSGMASLEALAESEGHNLAGKPLVDMANPLDFSHGFPPVLSVSNTDSLAEQIQRAYPRAKVVKALNTMNAAVMTEPGQIPGPHDVFIAGDDGDAKATVRSLLRGLGWSDENIVDLGGIRAARGAEMYLPLWLSLMQALGTPNFNIHVVRASGTP